MVSRAWKPEDGASYSSVELGMAPDFQRADPSLWGIVEAKGLTRTTTIDLLRIVGAPSWDDRFDWLNYGEHAKPWPVALGGGTGGPTALAGVHALDCKDLQIKRLEVAGVPGAAICYQGTKLGIDSAWLYRVGWPLYGDYRSRGGSRLRGITSAGGHWWGRAWGSPGMGDPRGLSLRGLDARVLARGELVVNEAGYVLDGYTHHGDGVSFKVGGSDFVVLRASVGAAWFGGTVPENASNPAYQGPEFLHLREARNCRCEDSVFIGNPCSAQIQKRALVWVSFPFTDPLVFRRCVFVRGPHEYAFQINWASVVFENCDFIGWSNAQEAFELRLVEDGKPLAKFINQGMKFYAS